MGRGGSPSLSPHAWDWRTDGCLSCAGEMAEGQAPHWGGCPLRSPPQGIPTCTGGKQRRTQGRQTPIWLCLRGPRLASATHPPTHPWRVSISQAPAAAIRLGSALSPYWSRLQSCLVGGAMSSGPAGSQGTVRSVKLQVLASPKSPNKLPWRGGHSNLSLVNHHTTLASVFVERWGQPLSKNISPGHASSSTRG